MNTSLIPTFEGELNGVRQPLCNARTLHGYLESEQDFSNWIKGRIEKYGFIQELDYLASKAGDNDAVQGGVCSPVSGSKADEYSINLLNIPRGRGRPRIDYHLSLNMAKELCMVENNDKGRQARRYFIRMEERARGVAPSADAVRQYGLRPANAALLPEEKQLILQARKDWMFIFEGVRAGMTSEEIADKLCRCDSGVRKIIRRMRAAQILPPDPRQVALQMERKLLEFAEKPL